MITPTQRTMQYLRRQGCNCAVVEKWNQHVGEHGIRQDLFGIVDILVLEPGEDGGFLGIQACGQSFAEHKRKLIEECAEACLNWLNTRGGKLQIWSWRKVKKERGGKLMLWQPRIYEITKKDFEI